MFESWGGGTRKIPDLLEAFLERRTREFGGESGGKLNYTYYTKMNLGLAEMQFPAIVREYVFYVFSKSKKRDFLRFYPRDAMLARVIEIVTCLSVTRRYCVKTKKASGMISPPSGSPKTLVF